MNLDPKALANAALRQLPNFERELEADVEAAIAANDQESIYRLIPRLAAIDAQLFALLKLRIRSAFGREFSVRDFDAAIKAERDKYRGGERGPTLSTLTQIQINARPLRDISRDSLSAIHQQNDPATLFVRSGQMVHVQVDERQRPSIVSVSQDYLRGRLDRCANYIRVGEKGDTAIAPPLDVVRDIMALHPSEWGLPPLDLVVEVPTLRADGTVLDKPGYDAASRMLYMPAPGLKMRPIPDDPTTDEIDEAVELISDTIGEFPFLDPASRANTFGMLLTPIVRPATSGCTPIALIDAPQAGTGKSLLVDAFSIIATGRTASMVSYPKQEEEMAKLLGAALLQGRALFVFDNLEGVMSSPTLALVLTAIEYETRILGLSQTMVVANKCSWICTGNNIRPSGDMPRRCYHIRLDAKSSRPYQGRVFRHENLRQWISDNRAELLRALLIMARAWYAAGQPNAVTEPLGSFESWHRTIGGILHICRVEEFLGNHEPFLSEGDEGAIQKEILLGELREEHNDRDFTSGEIAATITRATEMYPSPYSMPDSLADVDMRKEGVLKRAIGRWLAKNVGAHFGERGLHLVRKNDRHRLARYRVLLAGEDAKNFEE